MQQGRCVDLGTTFEKGSATSQPTGMKKTIAYIFALIVVSTTVYAQRGLHIGVTVAPSAVFIVNQNNYETLDQVPIISRSELDYTAKWGYTAGVVLGFNFNRHWGIQSGVRYVRTGQNYEDTFNPGQGYPTPYHVVREVDLRYIRVPLVGRYKFDFKRKQFKMYTTFGPYIGWLLKASESVVINDVPRTDLTPTENKFNHIDAGLSVGVGGEYHIIPSVYISLGLALDYGLMDINGKTIKDLEWFSKNDVGYNRSQNFNAGLSFGVHYILNPGSENPFRKIPQEEESMRRY